MLPKAFHFRGTLREIVHSIQSGEKIEFSVIFKNSFRGLFGMISAALRSCLFQHISRSGTVFYSADYCQKMAEKRADFKCRKILT